MSPRDLLPSFFVAAFERGVDPKVAFDDGRRILAASEGVTHLVGAEGEIIGRPLLDLFEEPSKPEVAAALDDMDAGEATPRRVRLRTTRGDSCNVELKIRSHVTPGVHLMSVRDITERTKQELAAQRYELLRHHTGDVVFFIARDGRVIEANQAAESAYGYTRDELLTISIRHLRHETKISQFGEQFTEAFGKAINFETVHRRKDGSAFPVEVQSRPVEVAGEIVLLSVIRDISERRELQAKLIEADRLSTFGMVAAGIAHEINNPLAYALTNLEVLDRSLPGLASKLIGERVADPQSQKDLQRCRDMIRVALEGIGRVRTIVRDLKTFSRRDPPEGVMVDVHQVLDSALNIAEGDLRPRARIERHYGELPPVRGSSSRFGQVFLNLVINGAQAIPLDRRSPGEVVIRTFTGTDGWCVVEISDDGDGIPKDVAARLFEPFFTTKAGAGTGLGLHISRTIVEEHGGTLALESRDGGGTTARVRLPPYYYVRRPTPRELAAVRVPVIDPAVAKPRLLVVDDEEAIVDGYALMLAPTYDVEKATNVSTAIAKLEAVTFDLVLCDLSMPDGSGLDVHDHLTAHHPALAKHFLLMSGGELDPATSHQITKRSLTALEKPIAQSELFEALQNASSTRSSD